MRKKLTASLLASAAIGGAVVAAPLASGSGDARPNVAEIVVGASGASGFDDNAYDYDLLREALVATDLVDAVATTDDITVFAPRDQAFVRLANDLGYHGRDEAGVFAFLAGATGYQSAADPGLLDDVLLYHVSPGAKTERQLRMGRNQTLLQGASFVMKGTAIIDYDRNDRNARVTPPKNVRASNGIVHTVNEVMRPLDL